MQCNHEIRQLQSWKSEHVIDDEAHVVHSAGDEIQLGGEMSDKSTFTSMMSRNNSRVPDGYIPK